MAARVLTTETYFFGRATEAAPQSGPNGSTICLGVLITSYFYCLPLGRFGFLAYTSDIRLFDLVSLWVLFLLGFSNLPKLKRLYRQRSSFHHWGGILLTCVWLSLITTAIVSGDYVWPALIRAMRLTGYLAAAALIVALVDSPKKQKFLVIVFYLNIVIQALLAFGQGIDRLPYLWPAYWAKNYGVVTVGTLSPHHMHIAVVMLLGIALTITFIRTTRSIIWRIVLFLLLSLMIVVPIFSGTRTAVLGFMGLILGFLYRKRGRTLMVAMVVVLVLSVSIVFSFAPQAVKTALQDKIESRVVTRVQKKGYEGLFVERTAIWFELFPRAVERTPWLLVTGSGFQNAFAVLKGATGAHNNYLHALVELGVIGLAVYMRFLISILSTLSRTANRSRAKFEVFLARDAWAAFIAVLITMLVGETFWAQYSMFTLTAQILVLMALATSPLNWTRLLHREEGVNARALPTWGERDSLHDATQAREVHTNRARS